ncbi:hypothetical protein [Flagellimonas sp. S3867]|uniref:hypothetical protein n=1 Tax=Flagellimonas sp. S3867 TaxID=2768063 RepID=UPI001688A2F4|nr:hypothetical protein [Flagellimonas sp. S3867]
MKNTKTAFAMLFGSLMLILGACKQVQKTDEPKEEPKERVKPPEQIISLEESKSLYDNYSRKRVDLIQQFEMEQNPDEKFRPARFASYDYSTIKQYIDFIEQEAKDAHVDISSLRFYFGNYPDKEKFPDGKKVVHPRQNSIFIVPTIDVDGHNYGFYIGEDGKAKLIKDAVGQKGLGSTKKGEQKAYASFVPTFSSPSAPYAGQSLTLNRGSAGPPPDADY